MEFNDTSYEPPIPPRLKQIKRFAQAPSLEDSLSRYQVASAIAHVRVLTAVGIVNVEVADRIVSALQEIDREVVEGKSFLRDEDTDMYSALLRKVTEKCGTIAERLSVGRSDEDWLATDVRMFLRDTILNAMRRMLVVRDYLLKLADQHQEVVVPGYAHMQPRSRELLCFFFLSTESRLRQDEARFSSLYSRLNLLPSGLDSLVMQAQPLDRALLAKLLGFDGVIENTFDSVPEIDHLMEFASTAGILGVHLSQLAGELLLWMTQEFGFARIRRALAVENESSTHQKSSRIVEVLRSRSANLANCSSEIFNHFKGLPSRPSHEDVEVLSTVNEIVHGLDFVLELTEVILPALTFDTKRMTDMSDFDLANRANAIDYLIEKGFTPDKAVSLVEPLAEYCRKRKRSMSDLAPGEWSEFSPAFDRDIYKYVSSNDNLAKMGPRYEFVSSALAHGRQLLSRDEQELAALSDKVKSLTVEVPSTTE